MKIIFLNGPPGSGKDTAGRFLGRHPGCQVFKLINPAELFFRSTWAIPAAEWIQMREVDKDAPQPVFNGLSLRQAFISFSEDWMKPHFGQDIFGQLLLRRLLYDPFTSVAIITDSGFVEEAKPIVEQFGRSNCLQVQLFRKGCSFEGDSRSYWEIPELPKVVIKNDGSLEEFRGALDYVLAPLIEPARAAGTAGPG